MSSLTLDLIPDIEIDIEEELNNEDHQHALASCLTHIDKRPVNGSIVQALCGRLIRYMRGRDNKKPKCPTCLEKFNKHNEPCWYCGYLP